MFLFRGANNLVKELQRAINQQLHIHIIYLRNNKKTSQRTLRPLAIIGNRLKAYCLTRKVPRVFVIDNILAVETVVSSRAI
jgi:predicted DNA-binding transcriptional regulator YafY